MNDLSDDKTSAEAMRDWLKVKPLNVSHMIRLPEKTGMFDKTIRRAAPVARPEEVQDEFLNDVPGAGRLVGVFSRHSSLRRTDGQQAGLARAAAGGRRTRLLRPFLLLFPLGSLGLFDPVAAEPLPVATLERETPVHFATEVYPSLRANCLACHNTTKARAGLVLESPKDMLVGGDTGPSVVPGNADDSLLFTTAAHVEEPTMPPANNKSKAENLTPEQLALLKRWIDEGAKGDAVSTVAPQKWTLLGGPQPLLSAAITNDGRFAAAGRGQRIHLYDLRLGRLAATLRDPELAHPTAHNDFVHALAFDPEGRLASGGYRVAKIWERSPAALRDRPFALPAEAVSLAVSPDGIRAAAGTAKGSVVLVDLSDFEAAPVVMEDHGSAVTALAFSPDGATLYSASTDRSVKRRPVAEPDAVVSRELSAPVAALAVIDGGRHLALGGEDGMLRFVAADLEAVLAVPAEPAPDQESEAEVPAPPNLVEHALHDGAVVALAPADDAGAEFLAAYADGTVLHLRFDAAAPGEVRRFAHGAPVTRLAVSLEGPDGPRLATVGESGPVLLWNLTDGAKIAELAGDPSLAPAAEARRLAAAVAARQKAHWEREAPEAEKLWKAEGEKAREGGEAAAVARRDIAAKREALRVLENQLPRGDAEGAEELGADEEITKAREELLAAERALAGELRNRELSARLAGEAYGNQVAAEAAALEAGHLATALAAEVEALEKDAAESAATTATVALAFTPDGEQLVQGLAGGGTRLWSASSGIWLEDFSIGGEVRALAFARSEGTGLLVAFEGAEEPSLAAWNLPGREWTLAHAIGDGSSPEPFVDRVTALAFHPGGDLLLTGTGVPSRSGRIAAWHTADWTLAAENEEAHGDTITDFAFSPDGAQVASASTDRLAKVFDSATLEYRKTFEGHTGHVLGVAWNADGLTVATAGGDLQLKLWDFTSGQQKQSIAAHGKEIGALAYVGTSENLLTASGDKTVKLANQPLAKAGDTFFHAAAASADGRFLVAGGEDGVLRVWDAAAKTLHAAFPSPEGPAALAGE